MDKCRFCDIINKGNDIIKDDEYCIIYVNDYPVVEDHMLVIPKRHITSFFELSIEEIISAYDLLKKAKDILDEKHKPTGYTIGINEGEASGQTVSHFHIHIIPRYRGDVPDPTGGIINIFPGKENYLKHFKNNSN